MPRSRAHDRDLGIRKISYTTRVVAGAGIVFVAAFAGFLGERASGSAGASTRSNSTTNQVQQPGIDDGSGGSATPSQDGSSYQPQPQPQDQAPQAHTRSGGS